MQKAVFTDGGHWEWSLYSGCLLKIHTCCGKQEERVLNSRRRRSTVWIQQNLSWPGTVLLILPIRVVPHQAKLAKTFSLPRSVSRCIPHKATSFFEGRSWKFIFLSTQEGIVMVLRLITPLFIFWLLEYPLSIIHSTNIYWGATLWWQVLCQAPGIQKVNQNDKSRHCPGCQIAWNWVGGEVLINVNRQLWYNMIWKRELAIFLQSTREGHVVYTEWRSHSLATQSVLHSISIPWELVRNAEYWSYSDLLHQNLNWQDS